MARDSPCSARPRFFDTHNTSEHCIRALQALRKPRFSQFHHSPALSVPALSAPAILLSLHPAALPQVLIRSKMPYGEGTNYPKDFFGSVPFYRYVQSH